MLQLVQMEKYPPGFDVMPRKECRKFVEKLKEKHMTNTLILPRVKTSQGCENHADRVHSYGDAILYETENFGDVSGLSFCVPSKITNHAGGQGLHGPNR